MEMNYRPVGIIRSPFKEIEDMPIQPTGAFGIQGLGAVLVRRIEGDYYNVVGLPLYKLARILKQFGITLL